MSSRILVRQRRRLLPAVEYSLERSLPNAGMIFAKLGDVVKPETVIGEAKVSAGYRVFSLPEYLGGSGREVQKYLRRTIGARVYQGDVVAEKPGRWGFGRRQFTSPIDGVLKSFDQQTGQLTMQFAPATLRLPAGVRGKVVQVVPEKSVFVSAKVSVLFGAYGMGWTREGALKIIAAADEMITADMIESNLAGYIVAGGSGITRDALNRALAIGVKGVVTGGIAAKDLLALSGSLQEKEDVGFSLLVMGGLGGRAMDDEFYAFLQERVEQQVFILPREKLLLLPLPADDQSKLVEMELDQESYGYLNTGDEVRVLSGLAAGASGKVEQLVEAKQVVGSRQLQVHCLLRLDGGDTIEVPVSTIELKR